MLSLIGESYPEPNYPKIQTRTPNPSAGVRRLGTRLVVPEEGQSVLFRWANAHVFDRAQALN